jgi:peptidoglycan/xylan/chitin deacetylase (PgdA/CDA1 family)
MRVLALEYHDVVPDNDFDASGFPGSAAGSYKLTEDAFASHLDAIAATGVQATRAVDWLANPGPGRPLFFTFDDGGRSAHGCIADALEAHGWRGHFFVTGGRVDTPAFLSRAEVRDLHARGHVIGSHSFTHPTMMGTCPPAQLADEWTRSVGLLSDVLGEPVLTASVPGGFYTRPVAESAARAGLRVLFTSHPSTATEVVDGCRVVGRYTLRRWSTPKLAAALARGRLRPRASQWLLRSTLTMLRTAGGPHYTRIRDRFWAGRG